MEVFESTLVDYFSRSFPKRVINDVIYFLDASIYLVMYRGFEPVSVIFLVVYSLVINSVGLTINIEPVMVRNSTQLRT